MHGAFDDGEGAGADLQALFEVLYDQRLFVGAVTSPFLDVVDECFESSSFRIVFFH